MIAIALSLSFNPTPTQIRRASLQRSQQLRELSENRRLDKQGPPFHQLLAELHVAIAESLDDVHRLSYSYCCHDTTFLSDNRQPPVPSKVRSLRASAARRYLASWTSRAR